MKLTLPRRVIVTTIAVLAVIFLGSSAQAAYVLPYTDTVTFDGHTLTVHEYDPYASTMARLHLGTDRVTVANGAVVTDIAYTSVYQQTFTVTGSARVHVHYWLPSGWVDYYRTYTATTASALRAASATAGVLTVPQTSYVGSQYVTVTADGPLTFVTNNSTWSPNSFLNTGGCTFQIVGSYQSGTTQHTEATCSGPGSITGWLTEGSTTFTTGSGSALTVTDTAASAVPPTTTPTAAYAITTTGNSTTTYVVTITNTGTADGTLYRYVDGYVTPKTLANISAPDFPFGCKYNSYYIRGIRHPSPGFSCAGANIKIGQTVQIVVTP